MLHIEIQKNLSAFALAVTLDAPEEQVTVLLGPSGAGKSMTLAALAGFVTPDAGLIRIGERTLFASSPAISLSPASRHIGLVSQDLALFPHLTVEQNVAYGLSRRPSAEVQETVQDLLRIVHLDGLAKRRPHELSGGQQQRVALARALAIQPSLLLLDEPFSALDRPIRSQLRQELKSIQRQLHTTMLFVTHDLGEAYVLADNLAIIDRGRILQSDNPETVLQRPATQRVAEIVGVKNILPARVLTADCVRVGDYQLQTERHSLAPGEQVFACVRPERVALLREERTNAGLKNVMEGDILDAQSDGANVELQFRLLPPRLLPDSPFDLQILMPVYIYERLDLAHKLHWQVAIRPEHIHFAT